MVSVSADIDSLLASYPRSGAELPPAQKTIYADAYKDNREGADVASGAAQKLEQWMHRRIAEQSGGPVLELGAGTLNHLKFEDTGLDYDIVEPFASLYEGKSELSRVRDIYASQFDIEGRRYKRIVSVAVLEHIHRLPEEVALSATLLEEDGVFQAGIPSEGGLLWWAGWRFSTGLSYWLKYKMDYGNVMRHEHVSRADDIIDVVRHFFADVKVTGFPLSAKHLSFYQYIEARNPRLDVARDYIAASKQSGHV